MTNSVPSAHRNVRKVCANAGATPPTGAASMESKPARNMRAFGCYALSASLMNLPCFMILPIPEDYFLE